MVAAGLQTVMVRRHWRTADELVHAVQQQRACMKHTGERPSSMNLQRVPIELPRNITRRVISPIPSGIRNGRWSTRITLTSWQKRPITSRAGSRGYRMSTRYNNGSHYENHQRAAELHDAAAHAHRAAGEHGQQDHLTSHELSRQAQERSRDAHRMSQEAATKQTHSSAAAAPAPTQ